MTMRRRLIILQSAANDIKARMNDSFIMIYRSVKSAPSKLLVRYHCVQAKPYSDMAILF